MIQKMRKDIGMSQKVDNFNKLAWTVSLKIKPAQMMKNSSEKILSFSKRKQKLSETDDAEEFVNKIYTDF